MPLEADAVNTMFAMTGGTGKSTLINALYDHVELDVECHQHAHPPGALFTRVTVWHNMRLVLSGTPIDAVCIAAAHCARVLKPDPAPSPQRDPLAPEETYHTKILSETIPRPTERLTPRSKLSSLYKASPAPASAPVMKADVAPSPTDWLGPGIPRFRSTSPTPQALGLVHTRLAAKSIA